MTGEAVRLFTPRPQGGYEWALPANEADLELFRELSGTGVSTVWRAPRMRLLRTDDDGTVLRRAAMPWLGFHVLVLRDEAIELVGRLLAPFGELLALDCSEAKLAVFNARTFSGALDEDRSDIVRFGTGRIMRITHPVFNTHQVGAAGVFKLAEMPRGSIYLTQEVVEGIRSTGRSSGTEFVSAQ